ncbi:N-acetylneuraminate synthase family protein [Prochlorococcus marinus]|uniref:N-acetylneuraminate synthase family protein n=1 Tax=Prochlorococcus marinus TaxID=1219 RepID=UPI0022B49A5E|nr:N-acetylneuraminate synthase family protein [Prochlorococcus marinus]
MYIVAEIGVNHDGSLEKAIKLIDAAVECGCNAVKFQSFYANRLVSLNAPKVNYQLRSSSESESHYEMIKRLEFNDDKLEKALQHANHKKIDFITTPYDPLSAEEAYKIGVRMFKTASADLGDQFIHKCLNSFNTKKIILATGMSSINEVQDCLVNYSSINPTILHCVSAYPCPDSDINARCITTMKNSLPNNEIGFSDHSEGITSAIICASIGVRFFERHFTLCRSDQGPDHYASSDIKEMKSYVEELRRVENILGSESKKCRESEIGMSKISKKGIVAKKDLKIGDYINYENIYAIRPAIDGISIDQLNQILGRKVIKSIIRGKFIKWENLS